MSPAAAAPRATRLTGRAAVLAVVICAIALSLAYPVREYIAQRQQIDYMVAQQQTMLAQVKSLEAQQARLSSRRAVRRMKMIVPWYSKLWQSVQQADASPAK